MSPNYFTNFSCWIAASFRFALQPQKRSDISSKNRWLLHPLFVRDFCPVATWHHTTSWIYNNMVIGKVLQQNTGQTKTSAELCVCVGGRGGDTFRGLPVLYTCRVQIQTKPCTSECMQLTSAVITLDSKTKSSLSLLLKPPPKGSSNPGKMCFQLQAKRLQEEREKKMSAWFISSPRIHSLDPSRKTLHLPIASRNSQRSVPRHN